MIRLGIAAGAVFVAACTRSAPCPVMPPEVQGPRYVLLEGLGTCGGRANDGTLDAIIAGERSALTERLPTRACPITSGSRAREVFAEATTRPLVVIYSGHGACSVYEANSKPARCAKDARSELCFEDGEMAVDSLLKEIPSSVPYAMVVLNACFSANVDVRGSAVPISVLSASPTFVKAEDSTVLGPELVSALAGKGDRNKDGRIDDDELLRHVQLDGELRRSRTVRRAGVALPKLRRQAWASIPFLPPAPERSGDGLAQVESRLQSVQADGPSVQLLMKRERELAFRPSASVLWKPSAYLDGDGRLAESLSASEMFAIRPDDDARSTHIVLMREGRSLLSVPSERVNDAVARLRAGDWGVVLDNAIRAPVLWHMGRVEDTVQTIDGETFLAAQLLAVPCATDFGQCFEIERRSAR